MESDPTHDSKGRPSSQISSYLPILSNGLTRRHFLATLNGAWLAAVASPKPSPSASASTVKNKVLFQDLVALVAGEKVAGDAQKGATALLAVGKIFSKIDKHPQIAALTSSDSLASLLAQFSIDSFGALTGTQPSLDDLRSLCRLAQGKQGRSSSDPLDYDRDRYAQYIGLGLQTAGVLTAGIPFVGVPLAIAGIFAEPALKYAAQPGLDLSVSPIPSGDPAQTSVLAQCLLREALDEQQDSSEFAKALQSPTLAIPLQLDQTQTQNEIVNDLPKPFQDSANTALEEDPAQTDVNLSNGVQQATWDQLNVLGDKVDSLNTVAPQGTDDAQNQQQKLSDFQSISSEVSGGIQTATVIVRLLSGNSGAAQTFYQAATAIKQVYDVLAQAAVGAIGSFAMSGGMLTAAQTLMNLFGGGGPDPVVAALQRIEKTLTQIQVQLNRMEQKEDVILDQLTELYAVVCRDQQATDNSLNQLKATLKRVEEQGEKTQRTAGELQFQSSISQLQTSLRLTHHDPSWDQVYAQHLTEIRDYGINVAKSNAYTHGDQDQFDDVVERLLSSARSDLFFGFLPRAWAWLGIKNSMLPDRTGALTPLPNPLAWSHAVQAYLQLCILGPSDVSSLAQAHVYDMWTEGVRLREAAEIAGSRDFLLAADDQYLKFAGGGAMLPTYPPQKNTICDIVYETINNFAANNLTTHFTITLLPNLNNVPPVTWGRQIPFNGGRSAQYVPTYTVQNDPYDLALQKGWISLSTVYVTPQSSLGTCDSIIVYKISFVDGTPLEFTEGYNFTIVKTTFKGTAYEQRIWQNPDTIALWDKVADPHDLLEQIGAWIRAKIEIPKIRNDLPAELKNALQSDGNSPLVKNFEASAAILCLGRSIYAWRSPAAKGINLGSEKIDESEEAPIVGRIETYGILTTIEEVIAFLDSSIQRYSTIDDKSWWKSAENLYDWNWLDRIVNDLSATLFNAINIINVTDLPLEQGLPQIDSCLKQLAAYMVLQGGKVPPINRLSIAL